MTDEMTLWQGAKIAMQLIYRFLQEKRKFNLIFFKYKKCIFILKARCEIQVFARCGMQQFAFFAKIFNFIFAKY
jgi:hypothetical protein